jgi:tRNA dimethylallyltransferase
MRDGDVIFLMGPTASGKSALAMAIAARVPVEIVSVDSAQVYRGMDIGTAKPSATDRAAVPHHLIDICDPAERYSAGRFAEDARRLIAAIHGRGRLPLLVGGTGLYFRALQRGLARLPAANPAVRARIEAEAAADGWAALHRRLRAVDPGAAARIHPTDPQRIGRALEVYELTGRSLTAHLADARATPLAGRVHKFVIDYPDRARLHAAIRDRFLAMLAAGLVDEARALRSRGDLTPAHPSMRLVGYRQCWEMFERRIRPEALAEKGVAATRQLARRQLTWLRAEPGAVWLVAGDPRNVDKILKSLQPGAI